VWLRVVLRCVTCRTAVQNRIELAQHFSDLGFTRGVEIGVFEGYYSKVLLDQNPQLQTLWCIDSWGPASQRVAAFDVARRTLLPYADRVVWIPGTSLRAAQGMADETFDFVFIDANHTYKSVKEDITAWAPKVRAGGIVSGHDYYPGKSVKQCGVIPAVDEYVAAHGYTLHTTVYDGNNPVKDDRQPCWYFVKPQTPYSGQRLF